MKEASVRKRGGEISGICALQAPCGEGGSLQSSGRRCRISRAGGEQQQPAFLSVYAAQSGKKQPKPSLSAITNT